MGKRVTLPQSNGLPNLHLYLDPTYAATPCLPALSFTILLDRVISSQKLVLLKINSFFKKMYKNANLNDTNFFSQISKLDFQIVLLIKNHATNFSVSA